MTLFITRQIEILLFINITATKNNKSNKIDKNHSQE